MSDTPHMSVELTAERFTHLRRLEAEAIHIMREVAAEAENPVMLYSVGKDSSVLLHRRFHSCMSTQLGSSPR